MSSSDRSGCMDWIWRAAGAEKIGAARLEKNSQTARELDYTLVPPGEVRG
jgi:hypothetical protein